MKKKTSSCNCAVCNEPLYLKPFHLKRFKGPFTCSRVCRSKYLKEAYSGSNNPNHKFIGPIEKFFSIRIKDVQRRAKNSNLSFDLTVEYMVNLYNEQKGLCYYTKVPMKISTDNWVLKGQADIDVISVDKIEPEKGYTVGNIVFCCSGINKLKGSATKDELIYFIDKLIANRGNIV